MSYINHIRTSNSITLILSDRAPITIPVESLAYGQICNLLAERKYDEAVLVADKKEAIEARSGRLFTVTEGVVYINGEVLPAPLDKRLLQLEEAGLDYTPLINFWYNLVLNPSEQSKRALFGFLEVNHMPLTEDGCFIGYKYVDEDFMDCYTHTFDNHPGCVVSIDRGSVDPDPEHTCSTGLHVAAYEYASEGGHNLIEVKVNPKDVVTVPPDANKQKMRVCEYLVVRVHNRAEGAIEEQVYDEPELQIAEEKAKKTREAKQTEKSKESVTVLPDKSGRLRIPKSMLDLISPAGFVYVFVDGKNLIVANNPPAPGVTRLSYALRDGHIRIAKSMVEAAKLKKYKIIYANDCLEIG